MKSIAYLIIFLFGFKSVYAHNPDLASLMIYEQNGKSILLIKSALTAFEGEVDYTFGKGAYKTPEEFNQLVKQHFQKNCVFVVDGETIEFSNIQVQLGHEMNLFAELDNLPKTIKSFYIKSTLFKEMPNNRCEMILTVNGLPQIQYILNNDNQQEVNLKVVNNNWAIEGDIKPFSLNQDLILSGILGFTLIIIGILIFRKKYSVGLD